MLLCLYISSSLIAFLPPAVFVAMRNSVKRQRREIILDLQNVFDRNQLGEGSGIIPSFEFVKFKYFFDRPNASEPIKRPRDYRVIHWLVSAIPLSLTLFFLSAFCLTAVSYFAFQIPSPLGVGWISAGPLFAWVLLASFTGGYLFMLRAFYQAINNFDLSPLSFAGAWVNLCLGCSLALVFAFGILLVGGEPADWTSHAGHTLFSAIIVTSFSIGAMPDLASRNILRASRLRYYKKENAKLYNTFAAIPVEVIDGIDTEIRGRLNDYHISAVQNLAAANPLMLFVETPYGVYQIMDWVAQAQLCCSVGPDAVIKLWTFGIRTVFDLERLALAGSIHRRSRISACLAA